MMNSADVIALIEQLDDSIDDLEEDVEPLLNDSLPTTTKKLPLLDKAKIYVLIVSAIESLLFTYLRLHGVAAKEHAVFKELTRVKQYFNKIKQAESGPPQKRENMSLNKEAAGRILKHHLAGNNKIDLELREQQARESLLAKRKLRKLELEQKTMDDTLPEIPTPQSEPNEPYLSEGEIEDDGQPNEDEASMLPNNAPGQQHSENEVVEEGKSLPPKRRKSGGNKFKQSPKSKRQKRKHAGSSNLGPMSERLPGQA